MTQTFSAGSNRRSGNRWGVIAAVVGVTVVLGLLAACSRELVAPLTGDEPPIRVRGGTMYLDLLTDKNTDFEKDDVNDKKKWHIKGEPPRKKNDFFVVVLSGSSGCDRKTATGNKVDVEYSGGQSVEFKSNSNKTKITAQKDLEHPSAKLLKYEVQGGFISAIKVNGQELCSFDEYDPALHIYLLD